MKIKELYTFLLIGITSVVYGIVDYNYPLEYYNVNNFELIYCGFGICIVSYLIFEIEKE